MPLFKNASQKFTVLLTIFVVMWLLWSKGFKNLEWSRFIPVQQHAFVASSNATSGMTDDSYKELLLRIEILEKEVQLLKSKK